MSFASSPAFGPHPAATTIIDGINSSVRILGRTLWQQVYQCRLHGYRFKIIGISRAAPKRLDGCVTTPSGYGRWLPTGLGPDPMAPSDTSTTDQPLSPRVNVKQTSTCSAGLRPTVSPSAHATLW